MYKQIFNKSDGTPKLIENDDYDKALYTEIQPPTYLYQPIYFDGNEWIGTPYEEWIKNLPEIENESIVDEKDEIIADLSVQLLETQTTMRSLEKDVANLSITMLGGETDAQNWN